MCVDCSKWRRILFWCTLRVQARVRQVQMKIYGSWFGVSLLMRIERKKKNQREKAHLSKLISNCIVTWHISNLLTTFPAFSTPFEIHCFAVGQIRCTKHGDNSRSQQTDNGWVAMAQIFGLSILLRFSLLPVPPKCAYMVCAPVEVALSRNIQCAQITSEC